MRAVYKSFIIFLLAVPLAANCQTSSSESEKIATFCKIWGFLKYYHPVVAKGNLDWDQEFMSRVKAIMPLHGKEQLSEYYSVWISSLGEVEKCTRCNIEPKDAVKENLNLEWLSNQQDFTPGLIAQLDNIRRNRNQGENYYVAKTKYVGNTTYENEKAYADSVFPSAQMRLLALSRYWNIINYFFPYKYKIGSDWNRVLPEMVPKFRDAPDTLAYHVAMLEMVVRINDSHAGLYTKYTQSFFGSKWAPFTSKIIDNKAVVTALVDEQLCQKNDIRYGDAFLTVDGKSIADILSAKSKYINASNEAVKLRNASSAIFNGATDGVSTTFERNGTVHAKVINRYDRNSFIRPKAAAVDTSKILDGNVGYVNMGVLEQKDVSTTLEKLRNTTAIIFDVRNYPKGTMYAVASFLKAEPSPFVKFTAPDLRYPGMYSEMPVYYCGTRNKNPYAGKVILLFNEQTQSHAEFTLMALQTAANVVSIGSQTAGADGNVSLITLPGNLKTYMTGIGIFYPDGRETQRVGIVPDIEIKPTIAGLRQNKDEVLEKAMEVAKGKLQTRSK